MGNHSGCRYFLKNEGRLIKPLTVTLLSELIYTRAILIYCEAKMVNISNNLINIYVR